MPPCELLSLPAGSALAFLLPATLLPNENAGRDSTHLVARTILVQPGRPSSRLLPFNLLAKICRCGSITCFQVLLCTGRLAIVHLFPEVVLPTNCYIMPQIIIKVKPPVSVWIPGAGQALGQLLPDRDMLDWIWTGAVAVLRALGIFARLVELNGDLTEHTLPCFQVKNCSIKLQRYRALGPRLPDVVLPGWGGEHGRCCCQA